MTEVLFKRAHVIVSGLVQGVCFRAYTQETAQKLGLTGWVRNLPDSKVEIIAEGLHHNVQQLVDWAHHGPSMANVTNVDVEWKNVTGEFDNFNITR